MNLFLSGKGVKNTMIERDYSRNCDQVFGSYLRMAMKKSSSLIKKLDEFVWAYHLNRLTGGALISIATIVGSTLLFLVLEQFGRFGIAGRTVIFWFLIVGSAAVLARWVVWPLALLFQLRKGLTYEAASEIIGIHFPEISDRLLNVLQLQRQLQGSDASEDLSLLNASIEERTETLRAVPFKKAVNWTESTRLIRYAMPPVAIVIVLFSWKPQWVQEPAERILSHRQDFIPPPPFSFEILNERLAVPAAQAFSVEVQTKGEQLPSVVVLESSGQRYRMEKKSDGTFRHTFPVVRETIDFELIAAGVRSQNYTLEVLPIPVLLSTEVTLIPPAYTGLKKEILQDVGNLKAPAGTVIRWQFRSKDTESLRMVFQDQTIAALAGAAGTFSANRSIGKSETYWVIPTNRAVGTIDSVRYSIQAFADLPPRISIAETIDSSQVKMRYFTGEVKDDYGFSRLTFAYTWLELAKREEDVFVSDALSVAAGTTFRKSLERPSGKTDRFFYEWSLSNIGVVQGDVLEYWFEVWDNDQINGPKMTRSSSYTFAPPSEMEIRAERDQANQDIASKMSEAREEAEALRKEMEEMRRQLGEDDKFDWKDERSMEELMKRQESLKAALEELQKANKEKDQRANEFSPEEERIMEKQEQLQELMEGVMNDELKAMYDEIQRLMEQMDPEMMEEMQQQLEAMEVDQESLEKELDRALEQFKQLEYEVNMQEAIEDLKELAEKQEALAEENESTPNDSLAAQQDSLNQEFESLQKKLDELDKANEKLENPNPTMERSDENESISEKMDASSNQLKQDKNKKAKQNQQDAAEEIKQMAEQMETMMQQAEEESMEEDMDALRALLENIIQLSFDEEEIMASLNQINEDDPLYITNGQTQRRLKDDAQMVEDSLFALSLRIPQLAPAVNREIGLINHHMKKALAGFGDRKTPEITENQQYVMTSFNNLALMLDDALQQMQQSMAESKPGTGNCEKPGGNGKPKPSPSAGDMKKMQQSLGEKLEKMKEAMGKGANAGQSGKDQRQLSKDLAQMAAQQAALRQMAQKKSQEMNADGSGDGQQMGDIAKEMEELERDLVNRDVSIETMKRQQELMVRLLEAENAEMTRGEDNKRKSKVGQQDIATNPPALEKYLKQKNQEVEWLRTIPIELDPYYRDRVNDYFNNLDLKNSDY